MCRASVNPHALSWFSGGPRWPKPAHLPDAAKASTVHAAHSTALLTTCVIATIPFEVPRFYSASLKACDWAFLVPLRRFELCRGPNLVPPQDRLSWTRRGQLLQEYLLLASRRATIAICIFCNRQDKLSIFALSFLQRLWSRSRPTWPTSSRFQSPSHFCEPPPTIPYFPSSILQYPWLLFRCHSPNIVFCLFASWSFAWVEATAFRVLQPFFARLGTLPQSIWPLSELAVGSKWLL